MSATPQAFRAALGSFATGVTIVTTRDAAGNDVGLTVNSFNSVSLEPPMILWSLARSALSLPAFMDAEHFAVHILAAEQEDLSNLFARKGADKFSGLKLERGPGDVPLLDGCAARFQCRTAFRHEGGDHEIFVGEVLKFEHFERQPLVFQGGRYALAIKKPAAQEDGYGATSLGHLLGVAHHQLQQKLLPALTQRGLTEADYFLLGLLGAEQERSEAELDALVAYTGVRAGEALLANLAGRGLLTLTHTENGRRVALTESGRQLLIELAAMAKAAEADVEIGLDFAERQMLQYLLNRLIHSTGSELPGIWR